MSNNCLDCGEKLQGRVDRKFCSDQCRVNYHNQKNRETSILIYRILSALKKNRKILAHHFEDREIELPFRVLMNEGFQSHFHTHTEKIDNRMVFFCFEYGFTRIDMDLVALVKAEENIPFANR